MGRPHGVGAEGMFPPSINESRKANTVSAVIGQVSNSAISPAAPPPPLIQKPLLFVLFSDHQSPFLASYVFSVHVWVVGSVYVSAAFK